jgi:hypothetical protein
MSNGFDSVSLQADLPRPESTVAIRPNIRSVEQAELALREIAWCAAVTAAIEAKAGELIGTIQDAAKKAASYTQGGEQVPVADRRAALEAELMRWAEENRATLCPGRKKSVDLTHGRIRWRDGKDSVSRLEGVAAKGAKEMIGELPIGEDLTIEAGPLIACLQRILDAVDFHGAITVGVDVNKSAATAAYKLKQITGEQLDQIGHEFAAGEEYVSVEPAEFVRAGVTSPG